MHRLGPSCSDSLKALRQILLTPISACMDRNRHFTVRDLRSPPVLRQGAHADQSDVLSIQRATEPVRPPLRQRGVDGDCSRLFEQTFHTDATPAWPKAKHRQRMCGVSPSVVTVIFTQLDAETGSLEHCERAVVYNKKRSIPCLLLLDALARYV